MKPADLFLILHPDLEICLKKFNPHILIINIIDKLNVVYAKLCIVSNTIYL